MMQAAAAIVVCKFAPMDAAHTRARAEIQRALERTGWSLTELARHAGVAPSTLTRFMNSRDVKHIVSTRTLERIRAAVAPGATAPTLNPADAVRPAPEARPPGPRLEGARDVPVYGVAACGDDGAFTMNMAADPVDYLPRPAGLLRATNVFAVYVQGSSMEPLFRHGEAVFCQEGRPHAQQDAVLVQLEDGPGNPPLAFLKIFVSQDDRELRLRQLNPPEDMSLDRVRVRRIWRALHWRELGQ